MTRKPETNPLIHRDRPPESAWAPGAQPRRARMGARVAALGALAAAVACVAPDDGDPTPGGGTAGACTPGEQQACACPGGGDGAQICAADGSGFGGCDCGGAGGTGGSGGGGGTGGGGAGGAAGTGGSGGGGCDASNCPGCCSGNTCLPGTAPSACGAHGAACQGCAPSFLCAGAGCIVDPASRWDLAIAGGSVTERMPNGDVWDSIGGMPDPFVVVYVGSASTELGSTTAKADTLTPEWNEHFVDVRADELGAYVGFDVWDEDLSSHDFVGTCSTRIGFEFATPEVGYPISCGAASLTYYVRRH